MTYKPFHLQDRYDLTIRFASGRIVQITNVAEETYGYLKKWLDGNWTSKQFHITDRNGTDMLITNPQHIETIIERKLKRESH